MKTRVDSWVKNIGTKRGNPYFYLDGVQAIRAGFSPGQKFEVTIKDQSVILSVNADGSRTVSSKKTITKKRGEVTYPVIDINSKDLLEMFEGMSAIRVVVQHGKVYLLPLASEIKKRERINRITENIRNGLPMKMGSISHGGGVLSHAIHEGLTRAGLDVNLAFANEIREDLLQHAMIANDAWTEHTAAIGMPMQELAQDEWLMSRLPVLDILEMGLPCSGASKAGASKRGLAKMEEHPDVGHLVFAGLTILSKTQPGVVLFENVPEYANSASACILRNQLRDMGYSTHEAILSGKDFGCLENRVRWCMVAATKGLKFSFENIAPVVTIVKHLGDFLDSDIKDDDPRYRAVQYLKDKQERDAEKGNSFGMQMIDHESTSVPTLRKGYHKGGSTDPRLLCPSNPDLSRLLTSDEHARIKQVPEHLIDGLSETLAHQLLGQGIIYEPFVAVGIKVGESLIRLSDDLRYTEQNKDEASMIDLNMLDGGDLDDEDAYVCRPCG